LGNDIGPLSPKKLLGPKVGGLRMGPLEIGEITLSFGLKGDDFVLDFANDDVGEKAERLCAVTRWTNNFGSRPMRRLSLPVALVSLPVNFLVFGEVEEGKSVIESLFAGASTASGRLRNLLLEAKRLRKATKPAVGGV
jgi:hypothetical protein